MFHYSISFKEHFFLFTLVFYWTRVLLMCVWLSHLKDIKVLHILPSYFQGYLTDYNFHSQSWMSWNFNRKIAVVFSICVLCKFVYLITFVHLEVGEDRYILLGKKWRKVKVYMATDVLLGRHMTPSEPSVLLMGGRCYRSHYFKKGKKTWKAIWGYLFYIFDQRRPYLDTTLKKDLPTYDFVRSKWAGNSCKFILTTKWILKGPEV